MKPHAFVASSDPLLVFVIEESKRLGCRVEIEEEIGSLRYFAVIWPDEARPGYSGSGVTPRAAVDAALEMATAPG